MGCIVTGFIVGWMTGFAVGTGDGRGIGIPDGGVDGVYDGADVGGTGIDVGPDDGYVDGEYEGDNDGQPVGCVGTPVSDGAGVAVGPHVDVGRLVIGAPVGRGEKLGWGSVGW